MAIFEIGFPLTQDKNPLLGLLCKAPQGKITFRKMVLEYYFEISRKFGEYIFLKHYLDT